MPMHSPFRARKKTAEYSLRSFLGMNAEFFPKKGMSLAKNRETFSQGHLAPIVRLESQDYNIICILIFYNPPIIHSIPLVRHNAAGWREMRCTISASSKRSEGS